MILRGEYMRINLWLCFLFCLWLGHAWADTSDAAALVPVPALQQRVTDLTGTLNSAQIATLEQKLAAFEQQKGSQLAVLLVPTTQPESIEQYSIRVASAWKLGRKGVDDGVLLLIAKADHTLRIEVGWGLEGGLTDAASKRIIDKVLVPALEQDDFFGGIDAALTQIIARIHNEALPEASSKEPFWKHALFMALWILFVPIAFTIKLISLIYHWKYGTKLRDAPFLQDHTILRGLVIFAENVNSSRGGGGSGSGGGGGFSGGGGGFGGGGASGRW